MVDNSQFKTIIKPLGGNMAVVQMDSEQVKELSRKLSMLPVVSDQEMADIIKEAGPAQKYENEEFESLEL
jgi:hypothetical protein